MEYANLTYMVLLHGFMHICYPAKQTNNVLFNRYIFNKVENVPYLLVHVRMTNSALMIIPPIDAHTLL